MEMLQMPYLKNRQFPQFKSEDFVIVYGSNRDQTGKATLCQSSFYGAKL